MRQGVDKATGMRGGPAVWAAAAAPLLRSNVRADEELKALVIAREKHEREKRAVRAGAEEGWLLWLLWATREYEWS